MKLSSFFVLALASVAISCVGVQNASAGFFRNRCCGRQNCVPTYWVPEGPCQPPGTGRPMTVQEQIIQLQIVVGDLQNRIGVLEGAGSGPAPAVRPAPVPVKP